MRYRTKDHDRLDVICEIRYGRQSGAVETVLAANPGLADQGVCLPAGLVIELPEALPAFRETLPVVRLWD